jgi:hypothetical protein
MRIAIAFVCLLAMPLLAVADAPWDGIYKSTTLGGPVFESVGTTSWTAPNGWLQVGNTTHMESFDGNVHATQWLISCPTIVVAPVLISDDVDANGDGTRTYEVNYSGGTLWLAGGGPWGNGDLEYQASVDSYIETVVLSYLEWAVTGCDVSFSSVHGHFTDYPEQCYSFAIGNKACAGNTDEGNKPGLYPDFVDPSCNPTRTMGRWEDVDDITLTITGCTVPNQSATWGSIKSLYD